MGKVTFKGIIRSPEDAPSPIGIILGSGIRKPGLTRCLDPNKPSEGPPDPVALRKFQEASWADMQEALLESLQEQAAMLEEKERPGHDE